MHHAGLLYPVLGTGCFFAFFWLGFVVAHGQGLHLVSMIAVGFTAGCAGASLIAQLERFDRGG
jgi:hypothetical protein